MWWRTIPRRWRCECGARQRTAAGTMKLVDSDADSHHALYLAIRDQDPDAA
ncbi:hypothetical protein [Streptomyces sp. NPDC001312]|uniref:hypothetical protein n=1 Tax=Streptomyces sp. NPDC001312 TaxID=3364561 RepID=UPI00368B016C